MLAVSGGGQWREPGGAGNRCADGRLDRQMDEWTDRLTGVCKRFAVATQAGPIICQWPSGCIEEAIWMKARGESLTQHGAAAT